jgi:hypothetical protein
MDSLDPKCTPIKQLYEACFYKWYTTSFLNDNIKDSSKTKEDPECTELFRKYQECLAPVLSKHKLDSSSVNSVNKPEISDK